MVMMFVTYHCFQSLHTGTVLLGSPMGTEVNILDGGIQNWLAVREVAYFVS
jgi:hypothetical protein